MRLDTPPLRDFGATQPLASAERHRDTSPLPLSNPQTLVKDVAVAVDVGATPITSEPPFDASRVAAIRAAIRDGTYSLQPALTASAIIAAKPLLDVSR